VRTIELRILGVALTALWTLAFLLILGGYRPGGPVDLVVGVAAIGPTLIAVAAVAWPPVARGGRAFAAIAWLGLGALLVLAPSIGGLLIQLRARGPQTLLPSVEAGYPWLLALLGTSLYAGLGIARRRLGETALRRRRLALGTAIGVALATSAGTLFAAASIANEVALRDIPAASSRFGPTDPAIEPPTCPGPLAAGATARLTGRLDMEVDGRRSGTVTIDGARNGDDFRWIGFAATPLTIGQHGSGRLGDTSWSRAPRTGWVPVPPAFVVGQDLDLQLMRTALVPDNRAVAEDRGLAFIEGARARHCRIALDGSTFRAAYPQVELLIGDGDLARLAGELDYWVFGDAQVGRVEVRLNGSAVGLVQDALLVTIRAELTAVDRGVAHTIERPSR
jgi:hypothetical protein